jgi:hypothetical protein
MPKSACMTEPSAASTGEVPPVFEASGEASSVVKVHADLAGLALLEDLKGVVLAGWNPWQNVQQPVCLCYWHIASHMERGRAPFPTCNRPGDLQLNNCTNFGCMLLHDLLTGKRGEGKVGLAHGAGSHAN